MGGRPEATQRPLSGTGTDTDDYLQDGDLASYVQGTEHPVYVLTNDSRGLVHRRYDEETVVEPGADCKAVAAVTDERVLLVVGGTEGGDHEISLPYTEIRAVETESGLLTQRLTITARTGDRYEFVVGRRPDLEAVTSHVDRAITYWTAVEQRLAAAKEHLSAIETHLEDGRPRAATDVYRHISDDLAAASDLAAEYRDGDHAMVRRIEQLDTRLTLTEIRGHRIRARQLREQADRRRANHDYLAALSAARTARDQCERAVALADDCAYHEFGAIQAEAAEIERAIADLEGAPLAWATHACRRAVAHDEAATAVDAWRTALEACHDAHAFCHREDDFDGDTAALRMGVEWAAANLRSAHRNRAAAAETQGDERRRRADPAGARGAYERAVEHRRVARDLASEFRTGSTAGDDAALSRLSEKLAAVTADAPDADER